MPLIQGGPPEWIWERTPNLLKWELVPAQAAKGQPLFELRVNCGLEIVRLQFVTREEIQELQTLIDQVANGLKPDQKRSANAEREPGNSSAIAGTECARR